MASAPSTPAAGRDEILRRHHRALVRLARQAWAEPGDFRATVQVILEAASLELDVQRVSVWLFSDDRSRLRCFHFFDRAGGHVPDLGEELSAQTHLAYFEALTDVRAVGLEDAANDPISRSFQESYLGRHGITSMCDAPVRVGGKIVGILCHEQVGGRREWTADDISFAGTMGDFVALALEGTQRLKAESRLRHLSGHDSTTGLPNRRLFLEHLEHLLCQRQRRHWGAPALAVLWLEAKRFTEMGHTHGHDAADEILRELARRLTVALEPGDLIGRIGDAFAVLLEEVHHPWEALATARRLRNELVQPLSYRGLPLGLDASVGIALAGREHPSEARDLLRHAGLAAKQAGERGQGHCELFDPAMRDAVMARSDVERGLHQALERGELVLAFQPIVDLPSRRVVGAEALVRWQRPGHGLVTAEQFIDVAETSGLIVPIGAWVLEQACATACDWQGGGLCTVRVNLSARQIAAVDIVKAVADALEKTELPPHCLCLEITESSLLERAETAREVFTTLKRLGVQVAIDDFGTGYASFAYLKQFPVDSLKIDKRFVAGVDSDPVDLAIVDSVLRLAADLQLEAVAEGVEREEQDRVLQNLGCVHGQGYFYARPLTAAALADQLRVGRVSAARAAATCASAASGEAASAVK